MTDTPKTRTRHSEQEKAQALLDSSNRIVKRLEKKKAALTEQLAPIDSALAEAIALRDYRASNPVLKQSVAAAAPAPQASATDPFTESAPGDPFKF